MAADRPGESGAEALARLYDLDLTEDPGDLDLYLALATRTGGPIIELAVGTGRIAVPLAAAGHDVIGVDDDPAMLERAARRAAATPGVGERLRLVRADMVDVRPSDLGDLGGSTGGGRATDQRAATHEGARLLILGLNSILLLADRDRQRRVFETMASLLAPGGLAVVDAWLPGVEDLVRFDGRLSLEWLRSDPDTGREVIKLAAAWYDAATRLVTLTTVFDEAEPGGSPVRWTRSDALRLIGPDEMRAFAEGAGLAVEDVAGDHELGPFGSGSERAVLLARKPG
jgi:SAM-dependent methyltransferase